MNKQQLLQIAQRNILEKRNNAIDRCDKLLAKLRTLPAWVECETNLKQAQVDYVMNGKQDADKQRVETYRTIQKQLLGKLKVDERVLIPRPETEEMVMMAVSAVEEGDSVLDLCTGSGAIAIAVKKELESRGINAKMTASDLSLDALALAQENAAANGAEIKFVHSDLFENIKGKFNVIVSNPPYIPTAEIELLQREVRDYEPRLALDGGADGLDIYRRIAEDCFKYLNRNGTIVMEVGKGQAQAVAKMFKGSSYSVIMKDFNDVERYVKIIT